MKTLAVCDLQNYLGTRAVEATDRETAALLEQKPGTDSRGVIATAISCNTRHLGGAMEEVPQALHLPLSEIYLL